MKNLTRVLSRLGNQFINLIYPGIRNKRKQRNMYAIRRFISALDYSRTFTFLVFNNVPIIWRIRLESFEPIISIVNFQVLELLTSQQLRNAAKRSKRLSPARRMNQTHVAIVLQQVKRTMHKLCPTK